MGGYGSGRYGFCGETPKETVEQYIQLSISDVKSRLAVGQQQVDVFLGRNWYAIPLVWTNCNYGSMRPWFRCPRCSKRVKKLYWQLLFTPPACRQCYDLTYESTRIDEGTRLNEKHVQLRRKLKASLIDLSPISPIPAKPKGMHWRTYWRILQEIELNELKFIRLMNQFLLKPCRRIEKLLTPPPNATEFSAFVTINGERLESLEERQQMLDDEISRLLKELLLH
jgi:hypothetical protein